MVKIKNKKGGNPDLYANHITILCSIAFLVIGAITIVVLCRLPQTALVKFIDNITPSRRGACNSDVTHH